MKRPQLIFIILVIALIGASVYTQTRIVNVGSTCELKDIPDPQWLVDYKSKLPANLTVNLQEDEHFDIDNILIKCIAQNIKLTAKSDSEAAQMALDYVYLNIKYDGKESNDICFESKASDILSRGTGQCDTQANLVMTLLKNIGLVVRPVGGCLSVSSECESKSGLYALVGMREPKIEPIEDIFPGEEYDRGALFGRGRSGLHAWVETYFPDEGWVILEATSGKIMRDTCFRYTVELFPENYREFCVSTDYSFVQWCRSQG